LKRPSHVWKLLVSSIDAKVTRVAFANVGRRRGDQVFSDYIRNVSQRGLLRNANDSIKRPRRNVRVGLGDVELVFVLMHWTVPGELRQ
jgi:hypothetical protein